MQIDPCALARQATKFIRRLTRSTSVWAAFVLIASLPACTRSPDQILEEARTLQSQNQLAESIPLLIELVESGDRRGEVLYRYGRALSLTGKTERSVWALDAARSDPEWFVEATQQLAMDAYRGGNFEFSIQLFEELREREPEVMENDLYGRLLEARVYIETHRHFDKALELAEGILEEFPEEDQAVRLKAVALLGLKRPDEAYELIRQAGLSLAAEGEGRKSSGEDRSEDLDRADGDVEGAEGEEAEAESSFADDLYSDVSDKGSEAYWCTVRITFKKEAKQLDEATKIADECLEKLPTARDVMAEAVELYGELGRPERVLEILEKAYATSPDDYQILDALSRHLVSIGRAESAEKLVRDSIAAAKADDRGASLETAQRWTLLAGMMIDQDRSSDALEAFDAAFEIVGESAAPELLLRYAEALIRAERWDDAIAIAEQTPVEVHQLMLKGRIAYERGEYPESLEILEKAALLWPDNAPIRYYRARAAEALGRFDVAIEEYRQAIRSDSALTAARERLARLHLAEGNVREAATILNFVSPKQRSTPSTAMKILMIETNARRGVEPDLNVPPTPDYPIERIRREGLAALARGLAARTNARVSERVLRSLEEQASPRIRGGFLRERVKLLLSSDRGDEAIEVARAGVEARPEDAESSLAFAFALTGVGADLDEAKRRLDDYLAQHGDEVDALYALAEIARRRGDEAEAAALYGRVLAKQPDHWESVSQLADASTRAGDAKGAQARLEAFLARDSPYDGRAALALSRMLEGDDAAKAKRIELAARAVRFRAGPEAFELLSQLDPAAAARLAPVPESAAAPGGDHDGDRPPQARDGQSTPNESNGASPNAGIRDAPAPKG